MSNSWPMVHLGEVLRRSDEAVELQSDRKYREITVKLWGNGVVLRGLVTGTEVAARRRQIAHTGQFILSRIDARNGAFGIVPADLDEAIVSNDFPVFNLNHDRLLPQYLGWLSRTAPFVERCQRASEGTTNRVRIGEDRFLAIEILLPPVSDQRRIVARIEELAAQIDQASRLSQEVVQEAKALLLGYGEELFAQLTRKYVPREFGSFSPHITSGPRNWAKHYEEAGNRFYRAQDIGSEGQVVQDSKVFVASPAGAEGRSAFLRHGDLMMVITGATVGRCALFRDALEPGFVSQHVAICRLPPDLIDPEFVLWGLTIPQGQSQLLGQRYGQGKPGLNLANIRALKLPFPPIAEQGCVVQQLAAVRTHVDELKRIQGKTAAELNALLPSILDRAFQGEL